MAELANCARCDTVFIKEIRDICQNCYKEEEKAFETVYQFLRQRKNREATMVEIVEATGVEESWISKFIKEKRLLTSQFPKLNYPCEKCEKPIVRGRLCTSCSEEIKEDLKLHEKQQLQESEKKKKTYYMFDS
ncbi:TIGR03826 family flagellar region protein [Virgibacillus oceani]